MSNNALVVRVVDGQPRLVKESVATPVPGKNQVLVKISHVAQNPTDVQSFDGNVFGDGAILGCDFAGEVVETGSEATRLQKGDIIAGLVWGGEIKGLGAYSEYVLADDAISFKVPKNIPLAEASTVPLALTTSWLALFSKGCLDIDRSNARGASILVWGGSSSVGLYAIQLAAVYGMNVITTCSPRHENLVRSYGAKHVFDYREEEIANKIKQAVPDIQYTFDTIGSTSSSTTSSLAMRGGKLCTVRPGKENTDNVASHIAVSDVLVWTAFLKDHRYGSFHWPASKEDFELSRELFDKLPGWIANGTIKPNTAKVLKGLEDISKGFDEYHAGKISGYKIVYDLGTAA
ncbi:Zinc-type alcohol dehydrogenase-like protein C2E1P3,01 [Talaromyces islandicus]|uniref:Zinc-type alcohol dehydrogenase-like protein C2E1P3,01 n=1 Tax=Talaromyces islandicus TaxID=28573 RepID=A0A0U1LLR8_TALIS|nr:Zinc-type alcohol dehydrogenase-like protein C2E1P3,01 [Talaromyces islandicus]